MGVKRGRGRGERRAKSQARRGPWVQRRCPAACRRAGRRRGAVLCCRSWRRVPTPRGRLRAAATECPGRAAPAPEPVSPRSRRLGSEVAGSAGVVSRRPSSLCAVHALRVLGEGTGSRGLRPCPVAVVACACPRAAAAPTGRGRLADVPLCPLRSRLLSTRRAALCRPGRGRSAEQRCGLSPPGSARRGMTFPGPRRGGGHRSPGRLWNVCSHRPEPGSVGAAERRPHRVGAVCVRRHRPPPPRPAQCWSPLKVIVFLSWS